MRNDSQVFCLIRPCYWNIMILIRFVTFKYNETTHTNTNLNDNFDDGIYNNNGDNDTNNNQYDTSDNANDTNNDNNDNDKYNDNTDNDGTKQRRRWRWWLSQWWSMVIKMMIGCYQNDYRWLAQWRWRWQCLCRCRCCCCCCCCWRW